MTDAGKEDVRDKNTDTDGFKAENTSAQTEDSFDNQETEAVAEDESVSLQKELKAAKDDYLRLYADFENFKRRTAKEKLELRQTAGEEILSSLLPVLDDFERAGKSIKDSKNPVETLDHIVQGIDLIHNKLFKTLEQKGLKTMDCKGKEFNIDLHEAITKFEAGPALKGKIVEEVEKGYILHEKVIRYAKVVVGV